MPEVKDDGYVVFEETFADNKGNEHPVLVIQKGENEKWPLKLGVAKLKRILDNLDKVTLFVEKYDKSQGITER